MQVTVIMDKLQEQKSNFAAYQQETAGAISDREKAIERLKAELKALGDRLEAKTHEAVGAKRQINVLELKLKDGAIELQV
jgi:chromosome segregation ATPase